jgi:hypothetical protein
MYSLRNGIIHTSNVSASIADLHGLQMDQVRNLYVQAALRRKLKIKLKIIGDSAKGGRCPSGRF